jgi:hypothetical protein
MAMLRLLAPLLLAFKVWMFVDAVRRSAQSHWMWIILFVPFGDVAYFFLVKMREPGMRLVAQRMLEGFKRPPSVEELEERLQQTPSLGNRIALAQGLFDADRFEESKQLFAAILSHNPEDSAALYGIGMCELELGRPADAIDPLAHLIDQKRSYRDWAAWPPLAEAYHRTGARDACLELLADLTRAAPRLGHQVLRARYLTRYDGGHEAKTILETALRAYERAPRHQRKLERPFVREAHQLLNEIEQGSARREEAAQPAASP